MDLGKYYKRLARWGSHKETQPLFDRFTEADIGSLSPTDARKAIGVTKSRKVGWSFSLPALVTCPRGRELFNVPGSVCSKCYAVFGMGSSLERPIRRYMANLRIASAASTNLALADRFVKLFAKAVWNINSGTFRWHSYGDVFSEEYAHLIAACVRATPHIRHWVPTHEGDKIQDIIRSGGPNVAVRLSADMLDEALETDGTSMVMTQLRVLDNMTVCPATLNGTSCATEGCAACYEAFGRIAYPAHGAGFGNRLNWRKQ